MHDSNRTLRFSRTAREAFGHDIHFDDDKHFIVWMALAFTLGMLVGMVIFGVLI